MQLTRLQSDLRQYLLHGDERIAKAVTGSTDAGVTRRLDIYREAYGLRLQECLQKDFPTLLHLVGDDAFAALTDAYIAAHPSRHYSVRYFGQAFSAFLAQHPDYGNDCVYTELAAFEWALMHAFDAPDAATVELATVATLPPASWPALRLQFHPSVQRLDLRSNAPLLWKAASADRTLPATEAAPHPTAWLVWRQQLSVYFRSLSAAEASVIDAARGGADFGELCVQLCAFHPEDRVAQEAAAFLKQWINDGLIREAAV